MERNLFILAVYILCVTYTIYKVAQSLDNHVSISVDKKGVEESIKLNKLQDILTIIFMVPGMCKLDEFREIGMVIINRHPTKYLTINWAQSTLRDLTGLDQGIINEVSDMKINPNQPQSSTTIGPQNQVLEKITTRNAVKSGQDGALVVAGTLLDFKKMNALPQEGEDFTLSLVFRVSDGAPKKDQQGKSYKVPFTFHISKTSRARVAYAMFS